MDTFENSSSGEQIPSSIVHRVEIEAARGRVWEALTNIEQMLQWMGEPEIRMELEADWRVGGIVLIKGFHHVAFENKGTVLEFDPPNVLRYNQLSSISRLVDTPENHTEFDYRLTGDEDRTSVTLTIRGFPTEAIFRHIDFYWRVTLGILKQFVETPA